MNLTDEDTKKALECCNEKTASECSECPLLNVDCSEYDLYKLALDLINRKQAVNELQAKEIVDLKIKVKEQKAEIEKFEKIDHFAQKTIDLQTAEIKKLEAEIERLLQKMQQLQDR